MFFILPYSAIISTSASMPPPPLPSSSTEAQFWTNARAILIQTDQYLQQSENVTGQQLHHVQQRLDLLQTSLDTLQRTIPATTLQTWNTEARRLSSAIESLLLQRSTADDTDIFGPNIDCEVRYATDDAGFQKRGRPAKIPNTAQVFQALAMGYTARDIAKSNPQFSESTLNRHIKRCQLRAKDRLSDDQLDIWVSEAVQDVPNSGYRAVCARLRSSGFIVTERAVQASVQRVDPSRQHSHVLQALPRRIKYWVPSPNSVWHFDGNHKLNHWGFVTHGCVDGYSRRIMWLEVKTDNYASSVLGTSPNSE
jgi:hypothetical protein